MNTRKRKREKKKLTDKSKSKPKSPIPTHHFKQIILIFLHPTTIHPIPISITILHLVSHKFCKFHARATAATPTSLSSVALDNSSFTRCLYHAPRLSCLVLVNLHDRDRSCHDRWVIFAQTLTFEFLPMHFTHRGMSFISWRRNPSVGLEAFVGAVIGNSDQWGELREGIFGVWREEEKRRMCCILGGWKEE